MEHLNIKLTEHFKTKSFKLLFQSLPYDKICVERVSSFKVVPLYWALMHQIPFFCVVVMNAMFIEKKPKKQTCSLKQRRTILVRFLCVHAIRWDPYAYAKRWDFCVQMQPDKTIVCTTTTNDVHFLWAQAARWDFCMYTHATMWDFLWAECTYN